MFTTGKWKIPRGDYPPDAKEAGSLTCGEIPERIVYWNLCSTKDRVGIRSFLKDCFEQHIIVHDDTVERPPRLPDLIQLDFFLRGYIKDQVYAHTSLLDLRRRLTDGCNNVTPCRETMQNYSHEYKCVYRDYWQNLLVYILDINLLSLCDSMPLAFFVYDVIKLY
ncbi:hypothetical protein TNCT_325541 [Trichonephila clavata]|uniref:Uncharacterized protein n=1 Tax=Trichonephila clavata TaxID=2740835 RepID=A0A8X6LML3_TRICU|nr:hypothetical protein TNCT_325541 [Trichonephila clavata]